MKTIKLLLFLLPLNIIAQTIKVIDLQTNDIIFNPYDNKIYATIPSSGGVYGNSICIIDPVSTQIDTAIFIGSEPKKIKLSDSGNIIYVALDGAAAVREFNVLTRTAGQQFSLGRNPSSGPFYVEDMEFLKGSDNSIVISRRNKGFSPKHEGVGIYDNGVIRKDSTDDHSANNVIEVISNNLMVGYNNESSEFGIRTIKIDANGVQNINEYRNILSGYNLDIYYSQGRIYSFNGSALDITSGIPIQLATFYQASGPVVADTSQNLICYASKISNKVAVKRYSRDNFVIVDTIISNNTIAGNVLSLITWGDNGKLALNTSGGKVVIFDQTPSEIKESNTLIKFKTFPNPTVDFVTIHVQNNFGSSKIQLISLTGKILKEETVTSYPHEIDLTRQIPGTYFLRLLTDEISGVQKIVKL